MSCNVVNHVHCFDCQMFGASMTPPLFTSMIAPDALSWRHASDEGEHQVPLILVLAIDLC